MLFRSLRDAVDDAIEQESGIGMASEFATNLAQKKQSWHEADWVKYKALLSVAGHPHLQDAIQLMHGLDAYELRPDVAATWDYAELILRDAGQCDVEGWRVSLGAQPLDSSPYTPEQPTIIRLRPRAGSLVQRELSRAA